MALSALWTGLIYDADSLQAATDLIAGWTSADRRQLLRDVPRLGLSAQIAGRSVLDIARELLALAQAGLRRRAIPGPEGEGDETAALEPLARWLDAGQSPADQLIAAFGRGRQGDIRHVYRTASMF